MKSRLLWLAILLVGGAALYFGIARPPVTTIPENVREPMADLKPEIAPTIALPEVKVPDLPAIAPPALPPLASRRMEPVIPPPEVPIQNQATIDFSTGAPVVKSFGKDQDALEAALKEIAEVEKKTRIEAKK